MRHSDDRGGRGDAAALCDPLQLGEAEADAILHLARQGAPHEVCGLLVGRGRAVVRIVPTLNAAASATEYVVPPDAHFSALRAARNEGLTVIGAYHSHPRSDARPSPRDAATAFEAFVFLIAGLGATPPVAPGRASAALRAWVFHDGNFAEVGIVRR